MGSTCPKTAILTLTVQVLAALDGTHDFGTLGIAIGKAIEARKIKAIPYIRGIPGASLEELKSFCASIATYGGLALFHMEGITPESGLFQAPAETMTITRNELDSVNRLMNDSLYEGQVDFVSLGCPHLSLNEIARVADRLKGKKVRKTFWITTARPTKRIADQMGYTSIINEAGAVFATDTCCVVAPIKGRFKSIATDSAKACYYAAAKNGFKVHFLPFDEVIAEALKSNSLDAKYPLGVQLRLRHWSQRWVSLFMGVLTPRQAWWWRKGMPWKVNPLAAKCWSFPPGKVLLWVHTHCIV